MRARLQSGRIQDEVYRQMYRLEAQLSRSREGSGNCTAARMDDFVLGAATRKEKAMADEDLPDLPSDD